ncbi:MAG: hypothetical protein JWN44_6958 [Myxococcales bacterium]|nr:hypothetical protein [Myxococcales bacterium]
MDLRCKVFRGSEAGQLEDSINRFLAEELSDDEEVQLEEITQSEGAGGVTITLWYSVGGEEAELVDEFDGGHPQGELA